MIQAFVLEHQRGNPFPALGYPVLASALSLSAGTSESGLNRSSSLPAKRDWKKKLLSWGSITVWENNSQSSAAEEHIQQESLSQHIKRLTHRHSRLPHVSSAAQLSSHAPVSRLGSGTQSLPESVFLRMLSTEVNTMVTATSDPVNSEIWRQPSFIMLSRRNTAGSMELGDASAEIIMDGENTRETLRSMFEDCDWVMGFPLGTAFTESA